MRLSPWHIVVLVVLILLLFGAKRLPDLARSVGQSLKILKTEVKDLSEDPPSGQTASNPGRSAPQAAPTNQAPPAEPPPSSAPPDQQAPAAHQTPPEGDPGART